MLSRIHGVAPGSSLSIIGSGPSAVEYSGQGDLSIGVNGAAMLGQRFDYFLYGDREAPDREWSRVDCSRVRVVAHHVASTDSFLYPVRDFPRLVRSAEPQSENDVRLPNPVEPHLHFLYEPFAKEEISRENNFLMYGGTISCCAAQLAFMMGAVQLNLFGCEFSHQGGSYFRSFRHIGSVNEQQRLVMDTTLRQLRRSGVRVVAYGKTRLTEVDEFVGVPG